MKWLKTDSRVLLTCYSCSSFRESILTTRTRALISYEILTSLWVWLIVNGAAGRFPIICPYRAGHTDATPFQGKGAMKTYFCDGIDETKPRPKLIKSPPDPVPAQETTPKRTSQVRAPPKGYRPLPKASPNGSITNSPTSKRGANKSSEPLLRELNNLEDSAVWWRHDGVLRLRHRSCGVIFRRHEGIRIRREFVVTGEQSAFSVQEKHTSVVFNNDNIEVSYLQFIKRLIFDKEKWSSELAHSLCEIVQIGINNQLKYVWLSVSVFT